MPESWSGNFVVDTVLYRDLVLVFFFQKGRNVVRVLFAEDRSDSIVWNFM